MRQPDGSLFPTRAGGSKHMKIVAAMDSFKGSLTSLEAGEWVKRGIHKADPEAQVAVCPLADGGEGTVQALTAVCGGRFRRITVTGPLGEPVEAVYGILREQTAVIEMAAAAGLTLVAPARRSPLHTTTYGVGEMIRDAVERGCRRLVIGIGGSATNDGGIGMLQALGWELKDRAGNPVPYGAAGLEKLAVICGEGALPQLQECSFQIICDVTNPLCGPRGCSAVFAPQKGADAEQVRQMDKWLMHYARLARAVCPQADPDFPGAGAAGGLGFAFQTFLGGRLKPGIQVVLRETGLEQEIREADLVITGEGCLDGQTAMGKAPMGVAGLAKQYQKPVIALAGCVTGDAVACHQAGIDAFFPILRRAATLEEAMERERAGRNLAETAEQVYRLYCIARRQ